MQVIASVLRCSRLLVSIKCSCRGKKKIERQRPPFPRLGSQHHFVKQVASSGSLHQSPIASETFAGKCLSHLQRYYHVSHQGDRMQNTHYSQHTLLSQPQRSKLHSGYVRIIYRRTVYIHILNVVPNRDCSSQRHTSCAYIIAELSLIWNSRSRTRCSLRLRPIVPLSLICKCANVHFQPLDWISPCLEWNAIRLAHDQTLFFFLSTFHSVPAHCLSELPPVPPSLPCRWAAYSAIETGHWPWTMPEFNVSI